MRYDNLNFYCLDFSVLYLSVGKEFGIDMSIVSVPNHFFIKTKWGNWETTDPFDSSNPINNRYFKWKNNINKLHNDNFYIKGLNISKESIKNGVYMDELTDKELEGLFYVRLAYDFVNKKDYDSALENYNKSLRLYSNYPKIYLDRAVLYSYKKDYDSAIQDCSEAIKLDPNYVNAYYARASFFYNAGDYASSFEDCNKAIELDPSYCDAYYNRAVLYDNVGNKEKSKMDLDEYKRLSSNSNK